MEINYEELVQGLTDVIKGSLDNDTPQIREYAERIVQEEQDILEQLAELRLKGTITDEEFLSELEDQKEVVQNQVLAIGAMSAVAAQNATNAAIKFLSDTVLSAVKALL